MAYELLTDLNYSDMWDFDAEQEFTNLGPGGLRGLRLLLPDDSIPLWDKITTIHKTTNDYLLRTGFPFLHNRLISLRSIEHNLCEYDKFMRVQSAKQNGTHVGLRRFRYNPSKDEEYLRMLSEIPNLYASFRRRDPRGFTAG